MSSPSRLHPRSSLVVFSLRCSALTSRCTGRCALPWSFIGSVAVLGGTLSGFGCSNTSNAHSDGGAGADGSGFNTEPIDGLSIDRIYFAQTHILPAEAPYLALVGNRDTLIKVQVLAPGNPRAPKVEAAFSVGDEEETIVLDGPSRLPEVFDAAPGSVEHSAEDSFIGVIPKAMMKPGLQVTVRSQSSETTQNLKVGAPNPMSIKMFDVHYFFHSDRDYQYSAKFLQEWEAKLPVSEMQASRVTDAVFRELVIPARADLPHVKISERAEYEVKTGRPFDGEVAAARKWATALTQANGLEHTGLRWLNVIGIQSDGSGGNFGAVSGFAQAGVFHHEAGHAFGLGHNTSEDYPYRGEMHGIAAPESDVHAGPTWAFDLSSLTFISPVNQTRLMESGERVYKQDPMRGGGAGDQEEPFLFRHFSDFNVFRMNDFITNKLAVERGGQFYRWNAEDEAYTEQASTLDNVGIVFPLEQEVEVYSVMAACFLGPGYEDINMIYPPLGPYLGNLMSTFDPRSADDRADAIARGFVPEGGSDYTLRILQGEETSYYMLPASGGATDDPLDFQTLQTRAVNVRASLGRVTEVTLLHTPDAEVNGLPAEPEVLASFVNPKKNVEFNASPVDVFEDFEGERGEDYDVSDWTEIQLSGAQPEHMYSEFEGVLQLTADVDRWDKHMVLNNVAIHNEDAVISVNMSAKDHAGARSIYFFYIDEYNFYQFTTTGPESVLFKVEDGIYTTLGSSSVNTGAPAKVEIRIAKGGELDILYGETPLISATVEGGFSWGGGQVALGAFERWPRWDNFSVVSRVN